MYKLVFVSEFADVQILLSKGLAGHCNISGMDVQKKKVCINQQNVLLFINTTGFK